MIFINLKTYEKGTAENAKNFVIEAEKIYKELGTPITILAQAVDIRMLVQNTTIPIWAQHVDNIDYGKNAGGILPQAVIAAGATGTMINHTEHKMLPKDVRGIIQRYQSNSFQILLSSRTPEEVLSMDNEGPSFLSYEPSLYIGMKTSILDISPDLVTTLVNRIKSPLVVGAGIHNPEHIVKGLNLGVKGFLISSDILTADSPANRLKDYMIAYNSVLKA